MKYCFILKNNNSKPLLHLLVLSRTNQTMIKKVLLEIFFAKVDIWDHKFIRTTMYLITCFFITFPQSSHLIQKLNQIKHFPLIFLSPLNVTKNETKIFLASISQRHHCFVHHIQDKIISHQFVTSWLWHMK